MGYSLSRRDFPGAAAAFSIANASDPSPAAMGPYDKFDLLIKGGDVLDPSQSLRGKRDIGIRYGLIDAVEPDISAARALRVLDAGGASDTGPDRPPLPRFSVWHRDWNSGRRTYTLSMHHHLCFGR
jgi:hypothetical protein